MGRKKGLVLSTFVFIILLVILIVVAFAIIETMFSVFTAFHYKVQTQVDTALNGNVSNVTTQMGVAYDNINIIMPWLIVFGFILGIFIYLAMTEVEKR